MRTPLFLLSLALSPAFAAPERGRQVFDLGIKEDEPHLRHRFLSVEGRDTEIRTRVSDLVAAGFEVDYAPNKGARLRRRDKEWVGPEQTLLVAQWFHTRLYIANQRELIAKDPRYEVVHIYYPDYPSKEGAVPMAAAVRDLAKSGLRPDFLDSGEPVLVDGSGKVLRGDDWAMAVAKVWQQGKGAEQARRAAILEKMGSAFSGLDRGAAASAAGSGATNAAPGAAPSAGSASAGTASDPPPQARPRQRAYLADIHGLSPRGEWSAPVSEGDPGANSAARSIRDVPVPDFPEPSAPPVIVKRARATPSDEGRAMILADHIRFWFGPYNPLRTPSIVALLAIAGFALFAAAGGRRKE